MAYITYADVNASLANLEDLVPDTKDAEEWTAVWITRAEGEIDDRLRHRYTVPFTTVPQIIKNIALDLTTYFLLRENYHQEDGQLNDWVKDYERRASDLLELISDGTIALESTDTTGVAISSTTGVERTFTKTKYDSDGNVIGNPGSFESSW